MRESVLLLFEEVVFVIGSKVTCASVGISEGSLIVRTKGFSIQSEGRSRTLPAALLRDVDVGLRRDDGCKLAYRFPWQSGIRLVPLDRRDCLSIPDIAMIRAVRVALH